MKKNGDVVEDVVLRKPTHDDTTKQQRPQRFTS
jgi:hypothetical protein